MKLIKNIQYMICEGQPRCGIFQKLEGERIFCYFGDSWEEAGKQEEQTYIILKKNPIYKLSKEEVIADVI